MINFDAEEFWNSLPTEHIVGGHDVVRRLGIAHNHNELRYEYRNSSYFMGLLDNTPRTISEEDSLTNVNTIGDWLRHFERGNTEPTPFVVRELALKWGYHLLASGSEPALKYYRFSENHLEGGKDGVLSMISTTIELYNKMSTGDNPDTFKLTDIFEGLWALCDAGRADLVIQIGELFLSLANDPHSTFVKKYTTKTNRIIDSVDRFGMSISFALAQAYKHLDDYENAKRIYRGIMSRMTPYRIHYYCGNNRGLEAGLELYKLEPTDEVKDWCFNQWGVLTKLKIENTNESLDERLMIAYMFMRVIYNIEI